MKRTGPIRWRISFGVLLSFCFAVPAQAESPLREIKVQVAVSSHFRNDPNWQEDIQDRITYANKVFEKEANIFFRVKHYEFWDPEDETREAAILMEELKNQFPPGKDSIVMGFHRMSQPYKQRAIEDFDTVGSARFFRGLAIIRDPHQGLSKKHRNVVVAHEMGHLFGAVHVPGNNAIMRASLPLNPAKFFDDSNRRIVNTTRKVDFTQGVDSLAKQDLSDLIQIYELLIRNDPHSDFYFQLGSFYKKLDKMAKAVSIWEEAIQYHYKSPDIHRELGFHYYDAGRYSLAIRELGSAVAHYVLPSQQKQKAQTLNFLGVAYYEKGNVDQAIFTWLKGLASDPENIDLQSNLAAAYLQSGDHDRGLAEFLKLAAKNPQDPTILSNAGVAHMNKKEYDAAIELFERALQYVAVKADEKKQHRLLRSIPKSVIHSNIGAAYLEKGDSTTAITYLEKARDKEPNNFEIRYNLARAYIHEEHFEPAIKEIEVAFRYKKDDPFLYSLLGQCHAQLGDADKALDAVNRGLRFAKGDLKANFHKNKGMLLGQQQKIDEAIRELKYAITEDWNDADSHATLGSLYAQKQDYTQAKRSFKNATRIDPKHRIAKQALKKLEAV